MFNPQDESEEEDFVGPDGEEVLSLDKPSSSRRAALPTDESTDVTAQRKRRKEKIKPDLSARGRFGKPVESSDDEALEESGEDDDEEGDEEGWGRQYYSRPSTRREKEDQTGLDEKREEERDMEEREVKRLQRKGREAIGADDWGFELDGPDSCVRHGSCQG